ncbi:MAG TPA: DUF2059 domain-containing protein [Longimicrobium sp.]|nr:DUF2059 domain-containing protein [Longimicrobium sp.]
MKTYLSIGLAVALASAAVAVPARAQASAEQRAAATELLMAMRVPDLLQSSMQTMLDTQLRAAPELAGVQDVMREFVARYVSWEALREQYVEIYARTFTEEELREMTDFYRSDVGQKLARATPRLMAEATAAGERAVQQHRPELEQMIRARLTQPPPPAPAPPPARP